MYIVGERITVDPAILGGKPSIRGKRISVQTVLEFLAAGDTPAAILEQYPTLEEADIYACLKFASSLMQNNFEIEAVLR
jgi:uncharacterized protein (DUF433 family)